MQTKNEDYIVQYHDYQVMIKFRDGSLSVLTHRNRTKWREFTAKKHLNACINECINDALNTDKWHNVDSFYLAKA